MKVNEVVTKFVPNENGKSFLGGSLFLDNPNLYRICTVDMESMHFPLDDFRGRALPLLMPLQHGDGGGVVQYKFDDQGRVSEYWIDPTEEDDEPYFDLESLLVTKLDFQKLDYEKAKVLIFSLVNRHFELSSKDAAIMASLSNRTPILGLDMTHQGQITHRCLNRDCDYHLNELRMVTFAVIPTFAICDSWDFWQDYGLTFFCFGHLQCCYSVAGIALV